MAAVATNRRSIPLQPRPGIGIVHGAEGEHSMLYRFQSKASGDVIMAADHAQALLRLMGKDGGAQGILLPEQMPAALEALRHVGHPDAMAVAPQAAAGEGEDPADAVGLNQRAWPLIQLIEASLREQEPVVWGV
jgi:hypothetical protein